MSQSNQQVLLHLSLIAGLGPARALKVVQRLLGQHKEVDNAALFTIQSSFDLSEVYQLAVGDAIKKLGLTEPVARVLVEGLADRKRFEDELYLMQRHDVQLVTLLDQNYPRSLANIHLPPLVLYLQGQHLVQERKRLALVGSRDMSEYGKQVVTQLVPELVGAGFDIVSGGAYGVDSAAHQTTLDVGGRTVVVLGSGLLNVYPRSNKKMFQQVLEQEGAVISAVHLYAEPDRFNFPARNRIISGLSQGTIVVQAAEKSGSLITAKYALEQGRQVFAVPGSVYDQRSVGCHNLIKQGAVLVHNAQDIINEFDVQYSSRNMSVFEQQKTASQSQVQVGDPLLEYFSGSMSVDELCQKTGLDQHVLHDKLFELQLEGKIKQNFIGGWERV
ncbi:MAG: DNA-protecting protein DprA [Epsilonproteobacteria bacterium]|nr:DNA-protecting protein DprA [Campylobacterota bacterium]